MIATNNETVDGDSLATIREAARKERLIDMELRLRRYRAVCFAILAIGLITLAPELGWWWIAPLLFGFCGFAVADRFMRASAHPAIWVAAAWGLMPLLLAGAVLATGGAGSPALMWFALPPSPSAPASSRAGRDRHRLHPRPAAALHLRARSGARRPTTSRSSPRSRLVLSTVTLSGALVESDRAHRRRSTVDPLTGLFNRNALEQRLAELDGDAGGNRDASHALLLCDLDHFKRVNDRLGHAAGDSVLQEVAYTMRSNLRAGDSIYRVGGEEILVVLPGATKPTRSPSPSACGWRCASCARSA